MFPAARRHPLHTIAWLNVGLHGVGLLFAAMGMRPGTPAAELAARMDYLKANHLGWSLGWFVWMLCVPALVAFMALTARMLPDPSTLPRIAVILVIVGAGFDLFCDSAYIVVLPYVARLQEPALFQTLEKLLAIGSLLIANGFYSVATLLITLTLHDRGGLRPYTVAIGYGVAGFGVLLAAAALTGWPWHVEWTAGPTIVLFCAWALLVAFSLESRESSP